MPTPFPGMDPFLESEWWQEFQATITGVIRAQLVAQVSERFVALLTKRSFLEVAGPSLVPQLSVEIREVHQRQLVTVIEILSPVNKRGDGARDFADRRTDLLHTTIHLLEIDLLRAGIRIALNEPLPRAPYYVYLSRAERRPYTQVWAIGLRDRLPTVPVPLRPPDADVALDLQAALQASFDLAHYERLLDYDATTIGPPELDLADAAWVRTTIAAAPM